jgi:hypothetical protein
MADTPSATQIAKRRVVYELENGIEVTVRRDIPYRRTESETLTFDLYRPTSAAGPLPTVLFVIGFSDVGMRTFVGCNAKDMQCYVSWGTLMAKSGMAAITYTTAAPATDVFDLLDHLRREHDALGVDVASIGLWACSGNVPNALSVLIDGRMKFRCAVLCYGFMLDLDGTTFVADAARMFRFVNPAAGRPVSDLPPVPMLVARAGRDEMPRLNDALDRFVRHAVEDHRPITLLDIPDVPHAFDLVDDSAASRNAIAQILTFTRLQLAEAV